MRSWTALAGVRTRVPPSQRKPARHRRPPPAQVAAPATRIALLKPLPNGSTGRLPWASQTEVAAAALTGTHGESSKRPPSPANYGRRDRRSCHGRPLVQDRATQPRYCIGHPAMAYRQPRKLLQEGAERDPALVVDCGLSCRWPSTEIGSK